jgi:hypothetical protein
MRGKLTAGCQGFQPAGDPLIFSLCSSCSLWLKFDFGPLNPLFAILYEDDDLLVINKPAGLVCHPTKGDEYSSLISRVRLHLGTQASAHLVNRLDRETSGVVLVAKNPAAAGELGKILESRAVEKEYLAIVHGHAAAEQGTIAAPLGKDEQSGVAVKDCVRADGAAAQTDYWVERRFFHTVTPAESRSSFESPAACESAHDSPSPGLSRRSSAQAEGEGRDENSPGQASRIEPLNHADTANSGFPLRATQERGEGQGGVPFSSPTRQVHGAAEHSLFPQ